MSEGKASGTLPRTPAAALSSSVGKKFVMALTGLLLCGFLVVHLAGNLLLYRGAEAYNGYAHALHSQEWFVKSAEVVLVLLFASHIYLAFRTTMDNRQARRVPYAVKQTKITEGVRRDIRHTSNLRTESWMFISGSIVLAFLLLHLSDFTWEIRPDVDYEGVEPFEKAITILNTPLSFGMYVGGVLILWAHLGHGFASAFQSLGLNHPRWTPLIKWVGILFAAVVGLGFVSFPIWAVFQ